MCTTPLPSPNNSSDGPVISLSDLNDARAAELIPAMVVLGLFMLVGTVGNLLVCYIFGFKLKHSVQHLLVVCLAVFDLLSCLVSIPADVVDMRYFYKFPSEPVCKMSRLVTALTSIGSVLTLVVIALDRYRKICKPTQRQMKVGHLKVCLGLVVAGAVFFSWPALVIFGMRSFDPGIPLLEATDCSTSDSVKNTVFPMLYLSILFLVFIVLCASLIIVYCRVLMVIKRHGRFSVAGSINTPTPSLSKQAPGNKSHGVISDETNDEDSHTLPESSESGTDPNKDKSTSVPGYSKQNKEPIAININNPAYNRSPENHGMFTVDTDSIKISSDAPLDKDIHTIAQAESNAVTQLSKNYIERANTDSHNIKLTRFTPRQGESTDVDKASIELKLTVTDKDFSGSFTENERGDKKLNGARKLEQNTSSRRSPRRRKHSLQNSQFERKTTIIAFLVTLVFILSFLPYLCLQVSKQIDKGYDTRLEGAALVAFNIFLRSYYFNSISNPLIYGALNLQFRHEVRILFLNLFKTCRK